MNVKFWTTTVALITTIGVYSVYVRRPRFLRWIISSEYLADISKNQYRNISDILWTYDCTEGYCLRKIYKSGKRTSLKTCNMICGLPQLWPYPKVVVDKDKVVSKFCLKNLRLIHNLTGQVKEMIRKTYNYMYGNIYRLQGRPRKNCSTKPIEIYIQVQTGDHTLLLNTNESYNMILNQSKVILTAETYFGARHGLETLSQLMWWDEVEESLFLLSNLLIQDAPVYRYRGLMLDTGNNYFAVKSIIRTLKGMSANKLNIFHWHITDFSSFPFQAPSYPNLSMYGAYDDNRIYTPQDITRVVNVAKHLGIRVIVEIDAPGHMLAGWEVIEGNVVVFNKINVTGEMSLKGGGTVLSVLKKLHNDIINITGEEEIFHIGGHLCQKNKGESNKERNSKIIQQIYNNLKQINKTSYTILWSSEFTQSSSLTLLNPSTTIIQITRGESTLIRQHGYGIIISDEYNWSLGCGLGLWTPLKVEPCYEYSPWQNIYLNDPWLDYDVKTIYGGELLLWSEQVGEDTLDNILWPRTAAFAENIWKGATNSIPTDVFIRLDTQRERLEHLGLDSSVMWPEWCTLNPSSC